MVLFVKLEKIIVNLLLTFSRLDFFFFLLFIISFTSGPKYTFLVTRIDRACLFGGSPSVLVGPSDFSK